MDRTLLKLGQSVSIDMGLRIGNGGGPNAAEDMEDVPHRPNVYVTDVPRDDSVKGFPLLGSQTLVAQNVCYIFVREVWCVSRVAIGRLYVSRCRAIVQAGCGYYTPLCRYRILSGNAGGSQQQHGHKGSRRAGAHVRVPLHSE